jgi:hypothetical protein
MKICKIIIASLLFLQTTYSANELSWVDTQIDAIKPARVGIDDSQIMKTEDPFLFFKKDSTKNKSVKISTAVKQKNIIKQILSTNNDVKQTPLTMKLSAIINNSALINGEWYRVNQYVADFIISSITRTSVVLTKGKEKLVLTTSEQNKNLKFK